MQWEILAGLRFLLVWIVVSTHIQFFLTDSDNNLLFYLRKLNAVSAILGFLLISGYSIANSISLKPEGFYKRRFLRIYPLYFCSILFSLIPFWVLGSKIEIHSQEIIQPDLWTVAGNLIFLQGWLVNPLPSNSPVWTLSIGVFCYLLAPFIIKISKKTLLLLLFIFSSLYILFPHLYHIIFDTLKFPLYDIFKYGLPFLLLFWSWLLGVICYPKISNNSLKILLVVLGSLMLVLNQSHTGKSGIFTYLTTNLVLNYSFKIKICKFLSKMLNYLGDISYPLYLFHMPSFMFAYSLIGIKDSTKLAVFALLTSMFVYHVIDVPLRSKNTVTIG